jgi:hypothetical protein
MLRRQHVDAHPFAVALGPSVIEPEPVGLGAQFQPLTVSHAMHGLK